MNDKPTPVSNAIRKPGPGRPPTHKEVFVSVQFNGTEDVAYGTLFRRDLDHVTLRGVYWWIKREDGSFGWGPSDSGDPFELVEFPNARVYQVCDVYGDPDRSEDIIAWPANARVASADAQARAQREAQREQEELAAFREQQARDLERIKAKIEADRIRVEEARARQSELPDNPWELLHGPVPKVEPIGPPPPPPPASH